MDTRNSHGVYSVHIGRLHSSATKKDLYEAFKHCGQISSTFVADFRASDPFIYGFVRFADVEGALTAVQEMDQWVLKGRKVTVSLAGETRDKMMTEGFLCKKEPKLMNAGPSPEVMKKTQISMDHLINESRFRDCCTEINIRQGIGGHKLNAERMLSDMSRMRHEKTSVLHGDLVGMETGNITQIKKTMIKSEQIGKIPPNSTTQFFEVLQEILENVMAIGKEEDEIKQNVNKEEPDKVDTASQTLGEDTENSVNHESIVDNLASAIKKTSRGVLNVKTRNSPENCRRTVPLENADRSGTDNDGEIELVDSQADSKFTAVSDSADCDSIGPEVLNSGDLTEVSDMDDCFHCPYPEVADSSSSSDSETERYQRFRASLLSESSETTDRIGCAESECDLSSVDEQQSLSHRSLLNIPVSVASVNSLRSGETYTENCVQQHTLDMVDVFTGHTGDSLKRFNKDSVKQHNVECGDCIDSVNRVTGKVQQESVCEDLECYLKEVLHIQSNKELSTQEPSNQRTLNHSINHIPAHHQIPSELGVTDTSLCTSSSESVSVSSQVLSGNLTTSETSVRAVGRGLSALLCKLKSKESRPWVRSASVDLSSDSEMKVGSALSSHQTSPPSIHHVGISNSNKLQDSINLTQSSQMPKEYVVQNRNMRPKARDKNTAATDCVKETSKTGLGSRHLKVSKTVSPLRKELKLSQSHIEESASHWFQISQGKKLLSPSTDAGFDNIAADSGVESDGFHNSRLVQGFHNSRVVKCFQNTRLVEGSSEDFQSMKSAEISGKKSAMGSDMIKYGVSSLDEFTNRKSHLDDEMTEDGLQRVNKRGDANEDGLQRVNKRGDVNEDGLQRVNKRGDANEDGLQRVNKRGDAHEDGLQRVNKRGDANEDEKKMQWLLKTVMGRGRGLRRMTDSS